MPSTEGVPSGLVLSHIISGSHPTCRLSPVSAVNCSWMRWRLPRQSEERKAPGSSSSSRPRNRVQNTRATLWSHGSRSKVSTSGSPTSSAASGPYPMYWPFRSTNRLAVAP